MDVKHLFAQLLNLVQPWTVKTVSREEQADTVEVYVECEGAPLLPCPACGSICPVKDFSPSGRWRHVDTCLKRTFIHAGAPVVECPEHGRRNCLVPWAGETSQSLSGQVQSDFLLTREFEKWVLELVRTFGDTRKVAVFADVAPAVVRRLVRFHGNKAKQAETIGDAPQARPRENSQLSLFAQNDMQFLNRAVRAFAGLRLEEARELFQKQRKHYPKGHDVSSRLRITEFLLEGLRTLPEEPRERPAHLCRLWESLEDLLKSEDAECTAFAARSKNAYFARVFQEIESGGGSSCVELPENFPAGFVLLQAGKYEEAIRRLQEEILRTPESAALYGWLADAYFLRGDRRTARQCYREACFIDPSAIDWRHLEDTELKELKQDILFEYDSDPELAVEWLPSHARIDGLFEPKIVRVNEGLKEMVESYLALKKNWIGKRSPRLSAKLFAKGIVLCDSGENLRFIKKIDVIEVRRMMKQANPDLFAEFLGILGQERL
ncbi:MAG: transposase family protein [Syntrophobacteraceae bacterium]